MRRCAPPRSGSGASSTKWRSGGGARRSSGETSPHVGAAISKVVTVDIVLGGDKDSGEMNIYSTVLTSRLPGSRWLGSQAVVRDVSRFLLLPRIRSGSRRGGDKRHGGRRAVTCALCAARRRRHRASLPNGAINSWPTSRRTCHNRIRPGDFLPRGSDRVAPPVRSRPAKEDPAYGPLSSRNEIQGSRHRRLGMAMKSASRPSRSSREVGRSCARDQEAFDAHGSKRRQRPRVVGANAAATALNFHSKAGKSGEDKSRARNEPTNR